MTSNPMMIFFQKLRLPLNRGEQNIYTFLHSHFEKFDKELETLLSKQGDDRIFDQQIYRELRGRKETVHKFYRAILGTLKAYSNGEILTAHRIFEDKMNEMQDCMPFLNLKEYRLFRIRADDEKPSYKRKELFHIPFEKTNLMRANRYSVPGFPCLYLGASAYSDSGLPLCWFECNLPNKFYWAEFEITNSAPTFLVIDFVYSPFSSPSMARWYLNQARKKAPIITTELLNFIMTYPLIAACSLIKGDKSGDYFVAEYIVPQMLLLWVQNNNICNGIAYPSASQSGETRESTSYNVAIPARLIKEQGHCSKLKKEFRVSKPNFIDIAHNVFKPIDQRYIDCRNIIYENLQTLGSEPLRAMVSVCDSFIILHSKVTSGQQSDMFLIYDYIKSLNLFAMHLKKFQESYISDETEQIKAGGYGKDTEYMISSYKDSWEKFIEFQNLIFTYWNFIHKKLQTPIPVFKRI
jgi:hypothetical protein